MLQVLICEDTRPHRKQIEKCVENCIMIHNLDMKVAISTENPDRIVEYVKKERGSGLYFLDVDLKHKIDGLELARLIREYDPRGFIVFITTHDEALPLTFHYKAEALDFILKEEFCDLPNKIYACILNAHQKYTAKATELQKTFTFTTFDQVLTYEYSKIYFLETIPKVSHKIRIHTTDGIHEFSGNLNETIKSFDESFYRCHDSYIINTQQELRLAKKERTIYFKPGMSCGVSARKLKSLIKILTDTGRGKVEE